MVYVTLRDRNRTRFAINHRLIERMDEYESTIILMQNGKKYIVDEKIDEIVESILSFESNILSRKNS
jgi:flagellar protein FlbD